MTTNIADIETPITGNIHIFSTSGRIKYSFSYPTLFAINMGINDTIDKIIEQIMATF